MLTYCFKYRKNSREKPRSQKDQNWEINAVIKVCSAQQNKIKADKKQEESIRNHNSFEQDSITGRYFFLSV